MHVSKKGQIFGRNSLFNLEMTAALLFKNYRLQTLKLSVGLSNDKAITDQNLIEFGMYVAYFLTYQFSVAKLAPYEFW